MSETVSVDSSPNTSGARLGGLGRDVPSEISGAQVALRQQQLLQRQHVRALNSLVQIAYGRLAPARAERRARGHGAGAGAVGARGRPPAARGSQRREAASVVSRPGGSASAQSARGPCEEPSRYSAVARLFFTLSGT
jgi:hypothetical protein